MGSFFSYRITNSYGMAVDYFGTKDFKVVSIASGKKGRIPITNDVLNGKIFLLINFCNSNSEPGKLCTLSTL